MDAPYTLRFKSVKDRGGLNSLNKAKCAGVLEFVCAGEKLSELPAGLTKLANLRAIDCSNNDIESLDALSVLRTLEFVRCSECSIKTLDPMKSLRVLTQLCCSSNSISSLEPLRELNNLTELDCGDNPIASLEPLSSVTSLTKLDFQSCSVKSLEPLRYLTKLTELTFPMNDIESLDPLERCTKLQELNCSRNAISRIPEFFKKFLNLRHVCFGENELPTDGPYGDLNRCLDTHEEVKLLISNALKLQAKAEKAKSVSPDSATAKTAPKRVPTASKKSASPGTNKTASAEVKKTTAAENGAKGNGAKSAKHPDPKPTAKSASPPADAAKSSSMPKQSSNNNSNSGSSSKNGSRSSPNKQPVEEKQQPSPPPPPARPSEQALVVEKCSSLWKLRDEIPSDLKIDSKTPLETIAFLLDTGKCDKAVFAGLSDILEKLDEAPESLRDRIERQLCYSNYLFMLVQGGPDLLKFKEIPALIQHTKSLKKCDDIIAKVHSSDFSRLPQGVSDEVLRTKCEERQHIRRAVVQFIQESRETSLTVFQMIEQQEELARSLVESREDVKAVSNDLPGLAASRKALKVAESELFAQVSSENVTSAQREEAVARFRTQRREFLKLCGDIVRKLVESQNSKVVGGAAGGELGDLDLARISLGSIFESKMGFLEQVNKREAALLSLQGALLVDSSKAVLMETLKVTESNWQASKRHVELLKYLLTFNAALRAHFASLKPEKQEDRALVASFAALNKDVAIASQQQPDRGNSADTSLSTIAAALEQEVRLRKSYEAAMQAALTVQQLGYPEVTCLAAPMRNRLPTVPVVSFSDLILGKFIGSGDTCYVYEAELLGTGKVVFKEPRRPEFASDLMQEAVQMWPVRHSERVVQLLKVCTGKRSGFVVEYVDGCETLADRVCRRPPLSQFEILELFRDMLMGLAAIHESRQVVLHRMQLRSVLIDASGRAKLGEFTLGTDGGLGEVPDTVLEHFQHRDIEILGEIFHSVVWMSYFDGRIDRKVLDETHDAVCNKTVTPAFHEGTPFELMLLVRICTEDTGDDTLRSAKEVLEKLEHVLPRQCVVCRKERIIPAGVICSHDVHFQCADCLGDEMRVNECLRSDGAIACSCGAVFEWSRTRTVVPEATKRAWQRKMVSCSKKELIARAAEEASKKEQSKL